MAAEKLLVIGEFLLTFISGLTAFLVFLQMRPEALCFRLFCPVFACVVEAFLSRHQLLDVGNKWKDKNH